MTGRATLTTQPRGGDYVLLPTGYSWNVRRSHGDGAASSISEGDRDRRTALSKVLSLAETDHTDAWETAGTGEFWRVGQFRGE